MDLSVIGAVAIPLVAALLYRRLIRPQISWRFSAGLFVIGGALSDVCSAMILFLLFFACPAENVTIQFYPPVVTTTESTDPTLFLSFHDALFEAAVPEQLSRFGLLLLGVWLCRGFKYPATCVYIGTTIALGFSCVENVGSYLGDSAEPIRVMAVLSHSFEGAILGYFVARAMPADAKGRLRILVLGFTVVTTLHFLYDFGLFAIDVMADSESDPENWPALALAAVFLLLLVWLGELIGTLCIIRKVRVFESNTK